MTIEMKKTDKITKDHSKYTHVVTVEYPINNVTAMKAAWRKALDQSSDWLEKFDERIETSLTEGIAKLELETANAQTEIESGMALSDDALFKKYKEQHIKYLAEMSEFVKGLDERKSGFEIEVKKQYESMKKKVVQDAKEKSEALKLWNK